MDYKEDLKNKLPELKKIEGFPIGSDEDILSLSDPPYFTACPNPYIADFIKEHGKPYDEATDNYQREPFVGDVSEGKNDPIYNAHSYHTKVPHKAIMKYIEHYTDEDDFVLDGFCGTGMTGVAAQLLNRKAILSDLSPIATFIAYNYNHPVDINEFRRRALQIIDEVEKECGWMYETVHLINGKPSQEKGRINDIIWSDVFCCPFCNNELIFWDVAVNEGKVKDEYKCESCSAIIKKSNCERLKVSFFDDILKEVITQSKQVPVQINYTFRSKRFNKKPDKQDVLLLEKIYSTKIPYWVPIRKIHSGFNTNQPIQSHNFTYVHHFFTKRNLYTLANFYNKISNKDFLKFLFTSVLNNLTKRYRYRTTGGGGPSGNLYIPSLNKELNPINAYKAKINSFECLGNGFKNALISNQSTTCLSNITDNSIDYIFTDPPFGENIMYSEMNLIWESWLKVHTNSQDEAIMNQIQQKGLSEYNV